MFFRLVFLITSLLKIMVLFVRILMLYLVCDVLIQGLIGCFRQVRAVPRFPTEHLRRDNSNNINAHQSLRKLFPTWSILARKAERFATLPAERAFRARCWLDAGSSSL